MQPWLLDLAPAFRGPADTIDPQLDGARLRSLQQRVLTLMADGAWRTLGEIRMAVGGSELESRRAFETHVGSAFGGHCVERRRRGSPRAGLSEYRILGPSTEPCRKPPRSKAHSSR